MFKAQLLNVKCCERKVGAFEGVGCFAGDCFCVIVNVLKKEVGMVLMEEEGCVCVILMRMDNNVCAV
jgi:hypothetical protein